MSAIFISQIMRFIEHHHIGTHFVATAKRIKQLIPKDLSRANDQWSVGILFSISGQNTYALCAKLFGEFSVL